MGDGGVRYAAEWANACARAERVVGLDHSVQLAAEAERIGRASLTESPLDALNRLILEELRRG